MSELGESLGGPGGEGPVARVAGVGVRGEGEKREEELANTTRT